MKKLFVICLLLVTSSVFCQTAAVVGKDVRITKKLSAGQREFADSTGKMKRLVILSFLNETEGAPFMDMKYFMLNNSQELTSSVKTLKLALAELEKKGSGSWDNISHSIIFEEKSKTIKLSSSTPGGRGFTLLNKSDIEKLIKYLEGIKLQD